MRARAAAVVVVMALSASCTGGDGAGDAAAGRPTSTTAAPATTTPAPASTTTVAPSGAVDPPGSVTLRATRFDLLAGAGLRVVVRASSPRLTVRRRGAGGALSACPVPDAAAAANPAACVDLAASRDVELASTRGVELRAAGGGATVEEVTVTYLPVDRSTTLVTPARPAGSCAPSACAATFSLVPSQPGAFALSGRAAGGRPRLTVRSEGTSGGRSRVLATAEGGGSLSITATLEPAADALVDYHELFEGPVGALVMEISWP